MIIIMKSRQEIAGLEIANSKLENCVICQLIFSNEIFRKARQILMPNSECNFWAVKVVDKDEKVLFYLRYEEDILDSYVVETNYQGEKLMNIVKNLDLDIIENYDKFVFADLDEYTYAIAELVLEYYRDKQIVFIEPFAELFFDDHRVVCINKVDYCADNNRIMYVSSKAVRYDVRPFTDKQISLFSSIMVIANLCWACRRQSKGTLNKDKTVVIVDYEPKLKMGGMGGMNAIISDVLFYCSKIRQKGWIPVVHLTNTQYSSDLIEDSWGYYFKSLSDVTYEDAMQSAHVIDGRENNFTWTPGRILLDAHLQDQFNVELSIQMQEYINEKTPYQFKENKRILGVIARGSDLKKATKSEFAIDDFVQIIKEQFESQYDYIFLATEESEYLEKFIAQFNEKLIYIKQTRIGYDYNNEKYKLIAEVLNLQGSQKTEFGRKYLLITYLLSQCNSLYSTINCGARGLAILWKKDKFLLDEIFYEWEGNTVVNEYIRRTRIQLKVAEFIKQHDMVIVYGIGRDARNYIPSILEDKIIYCDKKAKNRNILYRGHDVISPDDIIRYMNTPIIISSTLFGMEIKQELLSKGICRDVYLIDEFE